MAKLKDREVRHSRAAPNTRAQVRLAAEHEIHARPTQREQQTTGLGHAWWLVGLIAVLAIAIILIGLYTGT